MYLAFFSFWTGEAYVSFIFSYREWVVVFQIKCLRTLHVSVSKELTPLSCRGVCILWLKNFSAHWERHVSLCQRGLSCAALISLHHLIIKTLLLHHLTDNLISWAVIFSSATRWDSLDVGFATLIFFPCGNWTSSWQPQTLVHNLKKKKKKVTYF